MRLVGALAISDCLAGLRFSTAFRLPAGIGAASLGLAETITNSGGRRALATAACTHLRRPIGPPLAGGGEAPTCQLLYARKRGVHAVTSNREMLVGQRQGSVRITRSGPYLAFIAIIHRVAGTRRRRAAPAARGSGLGWARRCTRRARLARGGRRGRAH